MIDRKALFAAVTGKGKGPPAPDMPVEGAPDDGEGDEASAGRRALEAIKNDDADSFEEAIRDIVK